MMRLRLKEGETKKKRRDELLMAQQVWSPLGNTGAREEGHRHSAEDKGRESVSGFIFVYLCVCACVWRGGFTYYILSTSSRILPAK